MQIFLLSCRIDLMLEVLYNIINNTILIEVISVKKLSFTKNQWLSLISLGIVFVCYVGEKALKRLAPWSEKSALIQAFVFTLAVAAVFLILAKAKETYFGMIAGIFAFKIMPPDLEMLRYYNLDASCVYFIVRKMALVIFLYIIYRLYVSQNKQEKHIRALPIAALLIVVPFVTDVSNDLEQYAYIKTGSMMLPYALDAGLYIAAVCVLGIVCLMFKGKNAALVCDFSIIGFVVGGARKLCSTIILLNAGMHLSKSYICWIAIYAVLIAAFAVLRKKTAGSALIFCGAARE